MFFPNLDESLLVLTGAKAAVDSGPGFAVSYGMCKAATHHLARSIQEELNTICLVPTILDTPANREAMPDADKSKWTKLEDVAEKIRHWSENPQSVEEQLFIDV